MRDKFTLLPATAALVASVYMSAPPAQACSGTPGCTGTWVFPVGGPIESEGLSITYYSGAQASDGGVALPRLTRTIDGRVMDVSFDVVPTEYGRLKLTPREAQPVGATIRLETQPSPHCWLDAPLHEEYVVVSDEQVCEFRALRD